MREQELECVSENAMPQYREGLIDAEAVHAETQEHPNQVLFDQDQQCEAPLEDDDLLSNGALDQKKVNDGGNLGS